MNAPQDTTEYAQGFMAGLITTMFICIAAYLCVVAADAYHAYKECASVVLKEKK